MSRTSTWTYRLPTALAGAAVTVVAGALPAFAGSAVYGQWGLPGAVGSLSVPATGFPGATVTTDSSSQVGLATGTADIRGSVGTGGCAATGVAFTLRCHPKPLPTPPLPTPPVADTPADTPFVIDLPAQLCGGHDLEVTRKPQHGVITPVDNCRVRYAPAEDYTGPDAFGYNGHTATGEPVTGDVHVSVTARPQLAASGTGTQAPALLTAAALLTALGAAARRIARR